MSTSDLMQTEADAMPDPFTKRSQRTSGRGGNEDGESAYGVAGAGIASELDQYKPSQYLQTSDISDYKIDS